MEDRILEAVEYLTISLEEIRNYNDFLKYKPELMKAINDIKNIASNKLKKNNNTNETIENGEGEKSKISSILGLQFDYDPLINEEDAKFFSDYDENSKIKNKNKSLSLNNNNNNQKILKYLNENKKNKLHNPDTILNCTESLRNKNRLLNKKKNNIITNLKKRTNKNEINNNDNKNKEENKIKKYFDEKKQKERIDITTDIINKINSKDYLYKILTKLFGINLSDRLINNQVSDELLDSVKNAIIEIENINEKYQKINNINEKIEKLYQEKLGIMKEDQNKKNKKIEKKGTFDNINYKYGNEQKNFFYKPAKLMKKFKYSEPYQEFNFKKSLRNQTPKTLYNIQNRNNIINQSKIRPHKLKRSSSNYKSNNSKINISHKKPFISATSGYGKYFDEPLQNGGISKLN